MYTTRQAQRPQSLSLTTSELSETARASIGKVQEGELILKSGRQYDPETVSYFQRMLGIEQTGVYDKKTRAAVIAYQKENSITREDGTVVQLVADGDLGPRTMRSMVAKDQAKFKSETGLSVLGEEAFRAAIKDDWMGRPTLSARTSFPGRGSFDFERTLQGNITTEGYSANGVSLRIQHQKDLGKINPNLLEELSLAASSIGVTELSVSAITGHSVRTTNGNISNHVNGNALDIQLINGLRCDSKEGKKLADKLVSLLEERGFARNHEIGQKAAVLWGFNDVKRGGNHTNHIHLSLQTRNFG